MINIVKYDLGLKSIAMKDLVTEDRAKEFITLFQTERSLSNKNPIYIIEDDTKEYTSFRKRG